MTNLISRVGSFLSEQVSLYLSVFSFSSSSWFGLSRPFPPSAGKAGLLTKVSSVQFVFLPVYVCLLSYLGLFYSFISFSIIFLISSYLSFIYFVFFHFCFPSFPSFFFLYCFLYFSLTFHSFLPRFLILAYILFLFSLSDFYSGGALFAY
jgi:hypothetical protein